MEKVRCGWCGKDALYQAYHDNEWGIPVYDDQKLYELLLLETFQAGLSWITILKRREGFREAFDGFDVVKISNYTQSKFDELYVDNRIIKNKLKIHSAKSNAIAFLKIINEFESFSKYFWSFSDFKVIDNCPKTLSDISFTTSISDKISKDLKKRGFRFVGSTTIYAYMQAVGMVNDHVSDCWRRE